VSEESAAKRLVGTARGAITASATLITAVLGVVFLLVPSLRPLSRDKIEASLTIPAVESGVTVRDWAERQYPGDPKGALKRLLENNDEAEATQPGTVVYVRLRADGFKRRSVKLRARVYAAGTQRWPVPNTNFEQLYPEANQFKIDAPSRSSVQLILLSNLDNTDHRLFVRVEAFDDGGILAYADSGPILNGKTVGPPPP
jgi:hypothetical protein